jgi:cytochrome P450
MALHSALLVAFVLVFICYRYVLYPAFLSPLSKIPSSHPTASILPVWFWWKERTNCQARSLFDAHQRKGPVMRVEPNHVSVASLDGLRVIFHAGKFDRTDWVLQLRNYNGTPNLVSMLDSKHHATRRRIVSQVYSKSYILSSVDFQRLSQILLFDQLLPVFDEAAKTGWGVDVFELGYAIAVEFTIAYLLGTSNCLDIVRKGKEHERRMYLAAGKIKVLKLKGFKEAAKQLEDHGLDMCRKAEAFLILTKENKSKIDDQNKESASTYPVVYAQLRDSIPEKEGSKTPQETLHLVASELLDNMEAGRIAIGGALTYILHELTLRPALQSDLREELMTLEPPLIYPPGPNRISTTTLRKLDSLPLLNAVILETLRVRIPVLLPIRRLVPQGGAVINGFFLPAGTVVSSSAYTLHMNKDAFPEPTKWIPQRWLDLPDAAAEQIPGAGGDHGEMEKGRLPNDPRRWFWAFISGSKMCTGNNFALMGKSRTHYNGVHRTPPSVS